MYFYHTTAALAKFLIFTHHKNTLLLQYIYDVRLVFKIILFLLHHQEPTKGQEEGSGDLSLYINPDQETITIREGETLDFTCTARGPFSSLQVLIYKEQVRRASIERKMNIK
jgi:hypothetical protein